MPRQQWPLPLQPCGTFAAYQRHRKNGEAACEPCREANRIASSTWRNANLETARAYDRERDERPRCPVIKRNDKLKSNYGITQEQFDDMFEWQGSACACCGTQEDHDRQKPWNVDHCHDRLVIRGIVCVRCNRTLGQLGDNAKSVASIMTRLLRYLHDTGDSLSSDDVSAVCSALHSHQDVLLDGADNAHPDRPVRPKHRPDHPS